jgi:hypothetical protein
MDAAHKARHVGTEGTNVNSPLKKIKKTLTLASHSKVIYAESWG